MSARFLIMVLLLAALVTAATYLYESETKETLSDPGLADLERTLQVHGWPWGYYAEGIERVKMDENRVAVMEYVDLRWQMLGQTFLVWFIVLLVLISAVLIIADSRSRGSI